MGDEERDAGLPTWARGGAPRPAPAPTTGLPTGEPVAPGPTIGARRPDRIAGLRWLWRYVVVGWASLAGASALRLLDDWSEGAWWGADVALVALAALCAVLGTIVGVGAVGEGLRYKDVVRGRTAAWVGLALVIALGVATGLRAADDWYDLDIPAAVDRFEFGGGGYNLADDVDAARFATSIKADDVRQSAVAGECYPGDLLDPGEPEPCAERHRIEVLAVVEVDSDDPTVGTAERRDLALDACEAAGVPAAPLPEGVELEVVVPADLTWRAGDRDSLCVAVGDDPREGAVGG